MSASTNPNDEYSKYSADNLVAPCGLVNLGVTCWLNSILQSLLSCTTLNKKIMDPSTKLTPLAAEYKKLVIEINGRETNHAAAVGSLTPLSATSFLAALRQQLATRADKSAVLFGMSQECADEALTLIVDLFGPVLEDMFKVEYKMIIKCTGCGKNTSEIRDPAIKINFFTKEKPVDTTEFCKYLSLHTSQCETFTCTCGHIMTDFLRTEKLCRLSEICVITFNKYQSKEQKWFPQELTFNSGNGYTTKYRVVATIEHSGTVYGGHYWAFGTRKSTQSSSDTIKTESTHLFNDSWVQIGDITPRPETYMIFYEKTQ
jgi:uncharacterized UBP type Zn finger protein